MANTPSNVVATLNSMPQYVDWFTASFPEEAEPVSFDNFAKAIEAYEATLITPAPFDAWLNGDDAALSEMETAGLSLFIDKGPVVYAKTTRGNQLFKDELGHGAIYEHHHLQQCQMG